MKSFNILAINPGSTSTKFAWFADDKIVLKQSIEHSADEIKACATLLGQVPMRTKLISEALAKANLALETLDGIAARGGLLHPLKGGTYEVNQAMLEDLGSCTYGTHASNLGAIIATELAKGLNIKAFITDPVVVDEFSPLARFSGYPSIPRASIFHALNQKAVAKAYAKEQNQPYEELNLIVAHMGGGISVGAHEHGMVVDVNNALDGDGPFSAERAGGLPVGAVTRLCYGRSFAEAKDVTKEMTSRAGLVAYLGTNSGREVNQRVKDGDAKAALVYEAMAYQVAGEIARAAAVLKGKVDAILLTGGLAFDDLIVDWVTERINFIAPVVIKPGEDELGALQAGVKAVLLGEEKPMIYEAMHG